VTRHIRQAIILALGLLPAPGMAAPPKPILRFSGAESYTSGGYNVVRYRLEISNRMAFPAEMFAAAPTLPPCGANANSSRTWVDVFDARGHRLYGFCALSKPDDLGAIWFALKEGEVAPSRVYVELNDRLTATKYKSNLANTTPQSGVKVRRHRRNP
jgi:hypothetical protein